MEKRAFLRAEHMHAVVVIYVAGFIIMLLIHEARGMLGEAALSATPLSDAAFWPLNLLQLVV